MWSVTHDIDPDGDVIVVLKKPNTMNVIPEISLRNEAKLGQDDDATFRPDDTNVKIPTMKSGLPNNAILAREDDEVRFRVSSPHLKLASTMFKTMLSPPWKESEAVDDQPDPTDADASKSHVVSAEDSSSSKPPAEGTNPSSSPAASFADPCPSSPTASRSTSMKEVPTEGWHAYALLTVFNIIHGQGSRVPRKVSLEVFAQVALIADYYGCTDNLSTTAELWYELSKRPEKYGKEAIMWLFISGVFSWHNTFVEMARLMVSGGEGRGRVETHDLLIARTLDDLDIKRKNTIARLTEELRILDGDLRYAKKGCNNTCRSVMIGSLVIEKLNNRDLVTGFGHLGCHGVSLSRVIAAINDFVPTEWREASNRVHPCNVKKLLQPTIDEVEIILKRLNITDFKR